MRRKNGNPYTIKGSGISSFSIIGFLCFFLIIPLVLSLFVILDHKPYVKGYEEHLKSSISSNEIDSLNAQISKIEKQIEYAEKQIEYQEEYLNAQKESQIAVQESAINVKQAELDGVSASLSETQAKVEALEKVVEQAQAVLDDNDSVEITDSQVKLLKASMDKLKAQIATYNSQIAALRTEIEELEQEREDLILSITGDVEITKNTTSVSYPSSITLDAEDDTTYATEYIGYTEVYFYSIIGSNEPSNEGLQAILSLAREDDAAIDTLKTDLDALKSSFDAGKDKIAEYIAAYNTYKAAYDQAIIDGDEETRNQNLTAMNQTKDSISAELTNLQNIQAQIDSKLVALNPKLDAMEDHQQALYNGKVAIQETYRATVNKSQIENKEGQIQNIEILIDGLEDEIDGYKAQLTAYKNEQENAKEIQADKATELTTQKNNLQKNLDDLKKELENLKSKKLTNNVTEAYEEQIKEYNRNIDAINGDIAALEYLCSLTGSKFLEAAYADNYDDIYPYSKANAAGAFGLTAMLVSDMNVSVGFLNMLPILCYVLAALLAVLTLVIVIIRSYIAKKTSYTLEENVLTIRNATVFTGHEETRKVFYAPGMSVSVKQTLKGSIFNYGDVIVSMGLGNAGEIVMRNVKKPNKAKRILTEQLANLSYIGYPHSSNIPNMCNSPYAYGFGLPYMGMGGFGYYPFMGMGMGNAPDCSKCMMKNMLPGAIPQQPQEAQQ